MAHPDNQQPAHNQQGTQGMRATEGAGDAKRAPSPSLPGIPSLPQAVASVSSPDGLALTTAYVKARLSGKRHHNALIQAPAPPFLPSFSEEGARCPVYRTREDVHAPLRASGGRLLHTDATPESSDYKHPREIWVWDTTLFMDITYPSDPVDHPQFRVQGHLEALVNEEWETQAAFEKRGTERQHTILTPCGHAVVFWEAHLENLQDILACMAAVQHFAPPLPLTPETMLSLSKHPHFFFGQHEGRRVLREHLATCYPDHPIIDHWQALRKQNHGPCDVAALRYLCERDDGVRAHLWGMSPAQLHESRHLYEQWLPWINAHTETLPPVLPPPTLGPMLALPSLLMMVCAEQAAQHKMDQIVAHMTPDALQAWWCTPDALGKTGAQWFLSGLLGDGALLRSHNKPLQQRQRAAGRDQSLLPQLDMGAPARALNSIEHQRLTWATALLRRIQHVIGPQDAAWLSPTWSPAGLWFEALLTSKARALCLDFRMKEFTFLPKALWLHPARGMTSLVLTHPSDLSWRKHPRDIATESPFLYCAYSFTALTESHIVTSLLTHKASPVFNEMLDHLHRQDTAPSPRCNALFPFSNEAPELFEEVEQLFEEMQRLYTEHALLRTLDVPDAPDREGRTTRRRRV